MLTCGNFNSKIMVVLDCPFKTEMAAGFNAASPFGEIANLIAPRSIDEICCVSVLDRPLPSTSIKDIAVGKTGILGTIEEQVILGKNQYLSPLYSREINIFRKQFEELVERVQPNIIVTMGVVAFAVVAKETTLTKNRGMFYFHKHKNRLIKTIGTFSRNHLIKNPEDRIPAKMDFAKAFHEKDNPDLNLSKRIVYLPENLLDLIAIKNKLRNKKVAFDIECQAQMITCISFAPSIEESYVIPIFKDNINYWKTEEEEIFAWTIIKEILESNEIAKITHNGMFDVGYLLEKAKLRTNNWTDDTMLLHHSLYPELKKSLGFLASMYVRTKSWKSLLKESKIDK